MKITNSGKTRKILVIFLTLFALLSLFLNYKLNAQGFIEKHYKGYTLEHDSAVVMDVPTYRTIRMSMGLSTEMDSINSLIIDNTDSLMDANNRLIASQEKKLSELVSELQRRDWMLERTLIHVEDLDRLNRTTIGYLEEAKEDAKKPWKDKNAWIALLLGVVVGGIVIN